MKEYRECTICEEECEKNHLLSFRGISYNLCLLHYESLTYDYRELKIPIPAKIDTMLVNFADSQEDHWW